MKFLLRLVGILGFLLFASAFSATFIASSFLEDAGKEFIRGQVEREVREKIEGVRPASLDKVAGLLARKYDLEISDLKRNLKEGLPGKIATITTEMRDLSCECRKKLENRIRLSLEWRISSLTQAREQLEELIRGKYMDVVEKLMRDLRILTAVNAAIFLLLLVVSLFRAPAIAQLFLPAALLVIATLISSYFYLFQQNWFFTIIYNDYVGYGYIAYVSVIFLFLCDVVFNRARVTTEIINALLSAIGKAASLSPC